MNFIFIYPRRGGESRRRRRRREREIDKENEISIFPPKATAMFPPPPPQHSPNLQICETGWVSADNEPVLSPAPTHDMIYLALSSRFFDFDFSVSLFIFVRLRALHKQNLSSSFPPPRFFSIKENPLLLIFGENTLPLFIVFFLFHAPSRRARPRGGGGRIIGEN